MSDLDIFSQGSVYWYNNPFVHKSDYGNPKKNQDFVSKRPVLVISVKMDPRLGILNSVEVVPISRSSRRIGITIDMGNSIPGKLLPYNATSVKKSYLYDYKGHVSPALLEEVLNAVDFHRGRTAEVPKYIQDALAALSASEELELNCLEEDTAEDFSDTSISETVQPEVAPESQTTDDVSQEETELPTLIPPDPEVEQQNMLSFRGKTDLVYKSLHPAEKIYLNKLGVSAVQEYFSNTGMSWATAKKVKMAIAADIANRSTPKYAFDSLCDRLDSRAIHPFPTGLRFLSMNDAKLFVYCENSDLLNFGGITLQVLMTYKNHMQKQIEEHDNTHILPHYDDSALIFKETEKLHPVAKEA